MAGTFLVPATRVFKRSGREGADTRTGPGKTNCGSLDVAGIAARRAPGRHQPHKAERDQHHPENIDDQVIEHDAISSGSDH